VSFATTSQLGADGVLTEETRTTATGPLEVVLRSAGRFIQANGPERSVQLILQRQRLQGSGTLEALRSPIRIGQALEQPWRKMRYWTGSYCGATALPDTPEYLPR
jgi:hypothetical protein